MINITIEGESAYDVRKQIQELLGLTPTAEPAIRSEKIAENFETSKTEVEKPVETSKRKTKAEKALEAVQPAIEEQLGATDIQDNGINSETAPEESKTVTKEMLQEKAVSLIRNGKKEQVTATIKGFGADSISQADKNPVKAEDYQALMDAFNKIV